jgi:signal transduction histidine kinase
MTTLRSATRPRIRTPGLAGLLDIGLALATFALAIGLLASGRFGENDPRDLDALGGVLAALSSLPLVARRRAPHAVFVLTMGATALLYGLNYPLGPPAGSVVAIYTVALTRDPSRPGESHRTLAVVWGLVLLSIVGHLIGRGLPDGPELLLGALVWGGGWLAGDRTRLRRERLAELEERALRAEREAERERRLAAAEERSRIARDLHDSAGHAINVILVQAGAARLLQAQDPAGSRRALETVEEVARETIGEIDRLVRVLREDGQVRPAEIEPPGLAALDGLTERHRAAGLPVAVRVRGERRALPAGVDQAAYRILQEALTNAALHGDGGAAVEVDYAPGELRLSVVNPTRPGETTRAGGGHGIVGMRERASLLGGALAAGAENGAFRVEARLPLSEVLT